MHKRTEALRISDFTRVKVNERDDGWCIWCRRLGKYVHGRPEAHFIPRSQSGLGVEENILTLCRPCHEMFDRGTRKQRDTMRNYFAEYLKKHYPDWNEEDLIYKKGS